MQTARGKGWVALGVSVAVHVAIGGALALLPARGMREDVDDIGPPALGLVFEAGDEPGHLYLVPRRETGEPGAAAPTGAADAPREIGVTHGPAEIVPVTHTEPAPPTAAPGGHSGVGASAGVGTGADGAGGPGGIGRPGNLFQGGAAARSVVYAIDRSSSMGRDGLLAAAVRELRVSLERLPPTTLFQIIVYHDRAEPLLPGRLLPATAENVARASVALARVRPEGGTNHLHALQVALSLGSEVIYLLTDADDLRDADRREATRLNRAHAVIHTIELNTANRDRADMPLQLLARENRGRYLAVNLAAPQ